MGFDLEKHNALTKDDKSHEQKWDEKIKGLCDKINSSEDYFTTSSCSGRVTVVRASVEKVKDAFVFKSHDKACVSDVEGILDDGLYFRQEPCALHVACRTLEDAQKFLNLARNLGWKKSGIISSGKRFVIELFSTEMIVVPLMKNMDREFLELVVRDANLKVERTWGKILRLEEEA